MAVVLLWALAAALIFLAVAVAVVEGMVASLLLHHHPLIIQPLALLATRVARVVGLHCARSGAAAVVIGTELPVLLKMPWSTRPKSALGRQWYRLS